MDYRIFPPEELLQARVRLPLSKSISNRLIMIHALTPGAAGLPELAVCDDTSAMLDGIKATTRTVDIGAAGTAMRFLTAALAAKPGTDVTLTGSQRMLRRPIGPLVDALRAAGADITYEGEEGFPPLRIRGRRLAGVDVTMPASVSSQFISALMMAAPVMEKGLRITLEGEIVSAPYIRMTAELMGRLGAAVTFEGQNIVIEPKPYVWAPIKVEADWSAAAFWYEIAAISSGFVTIDGVERFSIQGDSRLAELYPQLGINTEFEGEDGGTDLEASPDTTPRLVADMTDTPDLVQAVVVTCVMLNVPFRLTGVRSLRIKETDRLEALRIEMLKLGCMIRIENDDLLTYECERVPVTELPEFDTYADHRMAMALAPVALFIPGIVVRDAEVVSKSYPAFWDDLRSAGFTLTDPASDSRQEADE